MGRGDPNIRGDFPKLRDGISRIRKIGDLGPELWRAVAPDVRRRIDAQFTNGTNPYGTKWKALAPATLAKGRTPPPLTESGEMRGSVRVTAAGWTLSVVVADPTAGFHQWGTRRRLAVARPMRRKGKIVAMKFAVTHVPKRQILPDGRIPNEWRRAIRKTARELMAKRLGRPVTAKDMG